MEISKGRFWLRQIGRRREAISVWVRPFKHWSCCFVLKDQQKLTVSMKYSDDLTNVVP